MNYKKPSDCEGMADIRSAIDEIDYQIVNLLAERAQYVHTAAKFKSNKASVKAKDRVSAMLEKRRDWATNKDLSPDLVEKVYRTLVEAFIQEEMEQWESVSTNK